MFKVVDKDGRQINMSFSTQTAADAGQLDGKISVGKKLTGVYGIEVAKDIKGLELQFNLTLDLETTAFK